MSGPAKTEKPYEQALAAVLNDSFETIEPAELLKQLNKQDSEGHTGWLEVILAIVHEIKAPGTRFGKLFSYLSIEEGALAQAFGALCQKDKSGQTGWKTIVHDEDFEYHTLLFFMSAVVDAPAWLLDHLCERDASGIAEWRLMLEKNYLPLCACLDFVKNVPGAYEKLCQAFCAEGEKLDIEEQKKIWEMIIRNNIHALPNFINHCSNKASKETLVTCVLTQNTDPQKGGDSLQLIMRNQSVKSIVLPLVAEFVYGNIYYGGQQREQKYLDVVNDENIKTAVIKHILQLSGVRKWRAIKEAQTPDSRVNKYLKAAKDFSFFEKEPQISQATLDILIFIEQGIAFCTVEKYRQALTTHVFTAYEIECILQSLGQQALSFDVLSHPMEFRLLVKIIIQIDNYETKLVDVLRRRDGWGEASFARYARHDPDGCANLIQNLSQKMAVKKRILDEFSKPHGVNGETIWDIAFEGVNNEALLSSLMQLSAAETYTQFRRWISLTSSYHYFAATPESQRMLALLGRDCYEELLIRPLDPITDKTTFEPRVKAAVIKHILQLPGIERNKALINFCEEGHALNRYLADDVSRQTMWPHVGRYMYGQSLRGPLEGPCEKIANNDYVKAVIKHYVVHLLDVEKIKTSLQSLHFMEWENNKLIKRVNQLMAKKLSDVTRCAILDVLCDVIEINFVSTKKVLGLGRIMEVAPDVLPHLLEIVKDLPDAPTRLTTAMNKIFFASMKFGKQTGWHILFEINLPAFIQLLDIVLKNKNQEVIIVKTVLAIDKNILLNKEIRTRIWSPMGHYYYQDVKDFNAASEFVAKAIVDYILALPATEKQQALITIKDTQTEVSIFLKKFPGQKKRLENSDKEMLSVSTKLETGVTKKTNNTDKNVGVIKKENSDNYEVGFFKRIFSQISKKNAQREILTRQNSL